MRTTISTLALTGLILVGSGVATAQAPQRAAMQRGAGVTEILNARRALDLTPRQVMQLDSIERTLWAERQRVQAQARPMGDSLRARVQRDGVPRDSASRAAFRRQMETQRAAMRPQLDAMRQRDSTARAAADRILNDTQRTKLREMQAERRGFERGMRAGRGQDGRRGATMGRDGRRPQGRPMAPRAEQRPPR